MTKAADQTPTLIDALRVSFAVAQRSPDGVQPPVALLWTDADGQWLPLIPSMRAALPELYSLGTYDPKARTGPVIWLKCVVDRTIPEAAPLQGVVPILYLPRISRQELRAGGDCPRELQPLIELQFRGAVWHQKNGRDWTIEAFLTSEQGLGMDIAQDARTREAMLRSLPLLASEPLHALRGRRVDAEDFDRLAINDPVRDLLSWMSDPKGFESRSEGARWATFRDVCRREFSLDVETKGPAATGDLLLNSGGRWDEVWRRFVEAPVLYPGVADRLREARPRDMFSDRSRQPGVNEIEERSLRESLEGVVGLPHVEACNRIEELEKRHGERRAWVWTRLGQSPLAQVLTPLSRLASMARNPLGGASLEAMASEYASAGWQCDRAAIETLLLPQSVADSGLIAKVVRAVYEPWLDRCARRFQELMASARGTSPASSGVPVDRETCILFVDGLRFDVAGMLRERLEARDLCVRSAHRIAPLPTVTATAKPLATPVHDACGGAGSFEDFAPAIKATGQHATTQRLRAEMGRTGVQILEGDDLRFRVGAEKGGWSEIGRLDELGHKLGVRIVQQVGSELDAISDRIVALLGAGWSRVRLVTDHGWILLPGGLPKVELPGYLVATRWARCAAVKGESSTTIPTFPWHWDSHARIATPPGIGSFVASQEYAHGGVSLQECVVPELVVERGVAAVRAKLLEPTWRGMRCRVAVDANVPGLRVDLRLNWRQPLSTIVAAVKELDAKGEASLAVADDSHEGAAATVVLLDGAGNVLDYKATTVGERE